MLWRRAAGVLIAAGCLAPTSSHSQTARHLEIFPIQTMTLSPQQVLLGEKNGPPAVIAGALSFPRSNLRKLPVVILVHGRGGLNVGHEQWSANLNRMGVATFVLDAFAGRAIEAGQSSQPPLAPLAMLVDAYRALEVLARSPRVDPDRIAIMGFGAGAVAALYGNLERFRRDYALPNVRFAASIGFYAPCNVKYIDDQATGQEPIRLFHGTSDTWLPIAACREYVSRLASTGRDAQLVEYAGAQNSFDNPDLQRPVSLAEMPTTRNCRIEENPRGALVNRETGKPFDSQDACVERGVTVAYDAEATTIARKDVGEFLRHVLHLEKTR
jgi:dienelactone hydrolase